MPPDRRTARPWVCGVLAGLPRGQVACLACVPVLAGLPLSRCACLVCVSGSGGRCRGRGAYLVAVLVLVGLPVGPCACWVPVGVLAGLPGGLHAGAPARGFVAQRRSNSPKDIRQSLPQCRHKPGNVYHSGTLNSTYKANNEPPKEFFGWLRICRGLVRPPAPLHPAQKWLSQRSRQDPWGCQTDWAGHEKSIGKKWAEHSKPKLKVGMATS